MNRKIGILGGTFNPVHNGHLNIAEGFRQRLGLDLVLLMPVWEPPHKSPELLLPGETRLHMCRLACEGKDWLQASEIEIRRRGKSYTGDTVEALHAKEPSDRLFLLMGADMFLTLETWRGFDRIVRLAELCGAARHDGELADLKRCAAHLTQAYDAHCHVESIPVVELSSTHIREKLVSGSDEDLKPLLPPGVARYIRENGLYGGAAAENS